MNYGKSVRHLSCGLSLFTFSLLIGLSSCQTKNPSGTSSGTSATSATAVQPMRIAYVNLDTLEAKYTYFKEMKKAFKQRQNSLENERQSLAAKLQSKVASFRQQAQAGTLTQAQGEAAQKKLQLMQQNMQDKLQKLAADLVNDQDSFNTNLQKQLDAFLAKYNKDKQYDYILSYMDGGGILLANPKNNITDEVVEGMNKAYAAKQAAKK